MAEVRNLQASYPLLNSVLPFSPFRPMSTRPKPLFASAGRLSDCHQHQHSFEQNGRANGEDLRRTAAGGGVTVWVRRGGGQTM